MYNPKSIRLVLVGLFFVILGAQAQQQDSVTINSKVEPISQIVLENIQPGPGPQVCDLFGHGLEKRVGHTKVPGPGAQVNPLVKVPVEVRSACDQQIPAAG